MNETKGGSLPRLVAVSIRNYRILVEVDVQLSPTTVIVGRNGAGKSTFLDAIAFASEVITSGVEKAVHGGGKTDQRERVLTPRDLLTNRKGSDFQLALTFDLSGVQGFDPDVELSGCRYELAVEVPARGEPLIADERVWLHEPGFRGKTASATSILWAVPARNSSRFRPATIRARGKVHHYDERTAEECQGHRIASNESALALRSEFNVDHYPRTNALQHWAKQGVLTLRLDAEKIRLTQPAASYRGLGDSDQGEYLTRAVRWLHQKAPEEYRAWLENTKLVLPELKGLRVLSQRSDGRLYLVATLASGAVITSHSLSEGTLRILALTILPYLPHLPSTLLVEEPEVSVHPQGIEAVMGALSALPDTQVLVTTQSPTVLVQRPLSDVLVAKRRADGAALNAHEK